VSEKGRLRSRERDDGRLWVSASIRYDGEEEVKSSAYSAEDTRDHVEDDIDNLEYGDERYERQEGGPSSLGAG
jgi:hypothetical protein